MKRFATVAVASRGIVLAVAHQRSPGTRRHALGRVSVALAPAAHGQIGNGVVIRAYGRGSYGGGRGADGGLLGFVSLKLLVRVQHEQIGAGLVAVQRFAVDGDVGGGGSGGSGGCGGSGRGGRRFRGKVQPVEYDLDVGGRDPVLEHGAVVEVDGAGPALQRAECDARRGRPGPVEPVRVGAQRLLFVGLGDDGPVGPAVHLAALARVELERLPRLAVVHALVHGYRVRFRRLRTELQVDVGELVLLAQRQRERDVVGRRQRGRRVHGLRGQRLRAPARRVVRVVGVGQIGRGVPAPGLRVITHVTHALRRGSQLAVPFGAARPARAGRLHVATVGGVHEVGHAPPGPIAVVARVRWVDVGAGEGEEQRAHDERCVIHDSGCGGGEVCSSFRGWGGRVLDEFKTNRVARAKHPFNADAVIRRIFTRGWPTASGTYRYDAVSLSRR